jgi:hypothetical protein
MKKEKKLFQCFPKAKIDLRNKPVKTRLKNPLLLVLKELT